MGKLLPIFTKIEKLIFRSRISTIVIFSLFSITKAWKVQFLVKESAISILNRFALDDQTPGTISLEFGK